MGDMADWARDQAEDREFEWFDHKRGVCGGKLAYCYYCIIHELESEELFKQIATGGSRKPAKPEKEY